MYPIFIHSHIQCNTLLVNKVAMEISGADPGFQVRGGAHLIVGVFRVKNHDFTPCRTNIIMSTYEYQYNFEVSHQSP